MNRIYKYLLVLCLLCLAVTGKGQEVKHFDINIYNDLPSNNVYNLTVDHLGYLWIATDKGTVKYNGYNLKGFDLNKGFFNKDSWNLFEDKSGNMWLYNLSDNLSYIQNDVVHNVKMQHPLGNFYPWSMYDYSDGVAVITTFTNVSKKLFCFIRNDSMLYSHDVTRYGEFIYLTDNKRLATVDTNGIVHMLAISKEKIIDSVAGRINYPYPEIRALRRSMMDERWGYIGHRLFSYSYNQKYIRTLNLDSFSFRKFNLDSPENIKLIYRSRNQFTAITDDKIYSLDDNFKIKGILKIDSTFERIKGGKIAFMLNDSFWQRAYGTNIEGVHFIKAEDTFIKQNKTFDLDDSKFIGKIADSIGFWYNRSAGIIYKVIKKQVVAQSTPGITDINCISPYNNQYSILFTATKTYRINNISLAITEMKGARGARQGIAADSNELVCISNIYGFYKATNINDSALITQFENNRYNGLVYDSLRQLFIAYNNQKIAVYRKNQPIINIVQKDLESRGINNITKVLPDNRFGNIIVQEGERLLAFADPLKPYQTLFSNYVLTSASVAIKNNVLIVSDAFGILFSKITGPGQFSEPVVYPNLKGLKYKVVYDIQVSGNLVLLKTDRGFFEIPLPAAGEYNNSTPNTFLQYKLVVLNNNNTYGISLNDTIEILRRSRRLQFDIIKPSGYGEVKYQYTIDEQPVWTELNSDELNLPRLLPGTCYTLKIRAHDKQWRSDVRTITLYMVPEWWEEPFFKRIMWIGGLLALLAIIYLIVIITRKIVVRKTTQRNEKLELELKSVYSQINPHFIFNSLTASMYLIKTGKLDEAYEHIYKFSHLLRSYIKSSRNRLIPLAEEIKNLTSYIELQQARFKNKFDYGIFTDEAVNTNIHIPSLLLQPIVENAISHGLLHKTEKGKLLLSFRMGADNNTLICNIDDDGIGREQAKHLNLDHTIKEESYGNELIKELINTFNKYEKMKIEIEYLDKQLPLTGTIVQLRIKHLN